MPRVGEHIPQRLRCRSRRPRQTKNIIMKMEQNKVTLLLGMMELYRRIINDRLKSNVVFGRYPLSNPDTENIYFPEARMLFREITNQCISDMHKEIAAIMKDSTDATKDMT